MACSRYEYVKMFEHHPRLLPGCWAVIRLDGRNFKNFAKIHLFKKPNDEAALNLSNAAAKRVLSTFDKHLVLAFGQSDEYSFVLKRESALFARRETKILSTIVSMFTSAYVMLWNKFMEIELKEPPTFDGRVVLYPTTQYLKDYLAWRQADVHVNNLFNTAFWALVQKGGKSLKAAEHFLRGSDSKKKNELLFSEFGINYNNEHQMFRKGSLVILKTESLIENASKQQRLETISSRDADIDEPEHTSHTPSISPDNNYVVLHVDIIKELFWLNHEYLLGAANNNSPLRIKASSNNSSIHPRDQKPPISRGIIGGKHINHASSPRSAGQLPDGAGTDSQN